MWRRIAVWFSVTTGVAVMLFSISRTIDVDACICISHALKRESLYNMHLVSVYATNISERIALHFFITNSVKLVHANGVHYQAAATAAPARLQTAITSCE